MPHPVIFVLFNHRFEDANTDWRSSNNSTFNEAASRTKLCRELLFLHTPQRLTAITNLPDQILRLVDSLCMSIPVSSLPVSCKSILIPSSHLRLASLVSLSTFEIFQLKLRMRYLSSSRQLSTSIVKRTEKYDYEQKTVSLED